MSPAVAIHSPLYVLQQQPLLLLLTPTYLPLVQLQLYLFGQGLLLTWGALMKVVVLHNIGLLGCYLVVLMALCP